MSGLLGWKSYQPDSGLERETLVVNLVLRFCLRWSFGVYHLLFQSRLMTQEHERDKCIYHLIKPTEIILSLYDLSTG